MPKETNIPPFNAFNSFKNFKFPALNMDIFLSSYQRNIELMNKTMKIATETTQSLMELQSQYVQKAFDQWNEEVKFSFSKTPLDKKTTHEADTVKSTVADAIKHTQNVSSILAKSNEQVIESIQKCFKEVTDKPSGLGKKGNEKP